MACSISVSNWLFGQAPPSSPFWELQEKKGSRKLPRLGEEEWASEARAVDALSSSEGSAGREEAVGFKSLY